MKRKAPLEKKARDHMAKHNVIEEAHYGKKKVVIAPGLLLQSQR